MAARGKLVIYLGYAAGVGKTYKMLEEAHGLRQRDADLVVGYFEPHDRKETMALMEGLEAIPRRRQEYRGAVFSEMDTEAVWARRPAVCVVDELAHTNAPGSPRAKRWQEVEWLIEHGIGVLTTMNVQHLESLNDQVWQISGVRVRETVPDWVVAQADEVVMVDLTPRALVHRLERGVVYPPEKAERALANFFKESTLGALRELTLRQTAHVTVARQEAAAATAPAGSERILIHITAAPATAMVIRRGKRVADYTAAECYAVYVAPPHRVVAPGDAAAIERHLGFARDLRIEARRIEGDDTAAALTAFARQHQITQIFCARPARQRGGDPLVHRIVRLARDMQVTVVAGRGRGTCR